MPRGHKTGHKRYHLAAVERMTAEGFSALEISYKLGITDRHVVKLRQELRAKTARGADAPIDLDDLRLGQMAVRSLEGFKAFYLAYSGYTYLPAHLEQAVRNALADPYTMVNIPPGFAKSEVFSVWMPIWLVCLEPDEQIILLSKTDTLAKKFANKISYQLTYNEALVKDWGPFKPEDEGWPWRPNSGELMVARRRREFATGDLTLQVRGSGQQILGMRATRVIADDPTQRKVAESEAEREKESAWFKGEVLTRLTPEGTATVIGQRVHQQDMYGMLEDLVWTHGTNAGERVFKVHKMKAITDGKSLWPEFWPLEKLYEREAILGRSLFNTMFQQDPTPEGGRYVEPAWIYGDVSRNIPGCLDRDRDVGVGHRLDEGYLPISRVISIDPGPTRFAGLVVADVAQLDAPAIAVLHLESKRQSMRQMEIDVEELMLRYGPIDYVIFEDSAVSKYLLQSPWIDRLRGMTTVLLHKTGSNKNDAEMGVAAMASDFEHGRLRLPYGSPAAVAMTEDFVNSEVFPWPDGKRDDVLMALWFVKFRWRSLTPMRHMATRFRGSPVGPAPGWERFTRQPDWMTHA